MGRYNNKRTQAAAQAARNTPSRARFSKGPPNKGGRGGKNNNRKEREPPPKPKSRGIGGGASNRPSGRGRRGNPQTTARVIDKIQNRVGGKAGESTQSTAAVSTAAPPSASTGNRSIDIALKNLDKSKLDVVAVSKETQNLIADLLRELGVVGGGGGNTIAKNNNNNNNNNDDDDRYEPPTLPEVPSAMEETTVVSTNDENNENDDDSVDSDQRMYDFLVEQSNARNTTAAFVEDEEEDGYGDGDEEDEIQKRLAANRRKKQREGTIQPQHEEVELMDMSIVEDGRKDDDDDPTEEEPQTLVNGENGEEETNDGEPKNSSKTANDFENDRTFLHLTQTLSFSRSQATKACRAIECWDANIKPQEEATSDGKTDEAQNAKDSKIMDSITKEDDNKIELAMDWLCLHLSEVEINRGFRPNSSASKASASQNKLPVLGSSKNTKIKAVAHPSISVISKPIEEQAKEWAKAIQLQERTLKLMRLGFHRADAMKAFDDNPNSDGTVVAAVIDDPVLPLLLSQIQDIGASNAGTTFENKEKLIETAREERDQELEALRAIYDDRLQIVYRNCDGTSVTKKGGEDNDSYDGMPERYILQIEPATPLGEPAKADECFLHVFLRDEYPVAQTPLLLLVTKPGLPPSLCRKILSELGTYAQDVLGLSDGAEMGCPVVFEAVSYLEENLPSLHKAFCNEQRRKEFEAEQARLLRQRQIEMERSEKAMELLYDKTAGNENGVESGLGRRQKAKIKAAEKAFDRPEQAKALYKEYRRKQDERVKEAQHQNTSANVRATRAQQAILDRQKELIDGEAEKAARSAMNEAFRKGKSREEAREAAEKARIESYRENGVTIVDENEKEEEKQERKEEEKVEEKGDVGNSKSSGHVPKPTEASSKFMERLRNTAGQSTTVTIDSSTGTAAEAKKEITKGPTPNTSAFMDRLREMYENAAKNGKKSKGGKDNTSKGSATSKLDGYHLDDPEDEEEHNDGNSDDESNGINLPRPVAVPAGELVGVMNDIITQQENQPWLVSSEARAPTTQNAERKKVSPAQTKREKEISERLKEELSRKRRMANEWADKNSAAVDGNGASNKKPKNNTVKGRKKDDNGFTPEKFYNMMTVRKR